jgi:hypothetical protein
MQQASTDQQFFSIVQVQISEILFACEATSAG